MLGHAAHERPCEPQCPTSEAVQRLFSQQPLGQLTASQTHAPPTQESPAPHGFPTPHLHAPAVQRSLAWLTHEAQTDPPAPQEVLLLVWHAPLKQQPLAQVAAVHPLQVPDWHCWPVGHC